MKNILEKRTFNNNDFNSITWHDITIHGIAFNKEKFELYFDIDFVYKWNLNKEENKYNFYISPATLVFYNVWEVDINIISNLDLSIENLKRFNPVKPRNIEIFENEEVQEFDWQMFLLQGEINFKSIGFEIFIRKKPICSYTQELSLIDRDGVQFNINK